MGIIFMVAFVVIAALMGSEKGYSGVLCGVAGFFGGLIAIIIIALLPNKTEADEAAACREAEHNDEIAALKKRIRDLEAAQEAPEASDAENKSET